MRAERLRNPCIATDRPMLKRWCVYLARALATAGCREGNPSRNFAAAGLSRNG
jgi:hypothetical protein